MVWRQIIIQILRFASVWYRLIGILELIHVCSRCYGTLFFPWYRSYLFFRSLLDSWKIRVWHPLRYHDLFLFIKHWVVRSSMICGVNHPTRVFFYSLSIQQAILLIVCCGILPSWLGTSLSPTASVYVSLNCLTNILVLSYHSLLFLISTRIWQITPLICIVDYGCRLIGSRVDPKLTQIQRHLFLYGIEIFLIRSWPLLPLHSPWSTLGGSWLIILTRCCRIIGKHWLVRPLEIRPLRPQPVIIGNSSLQIWVMEKLDRWHTLLMWSLGRWLG